MCSFQAGKLPFDYTLTIVNGNHLARTSLDEEERPERNIFRVYLYRVIGSALSRRSGSSSRKKKVRGADLRVL